jgi:solute carrier family 25 (mitochondrial phosphate transporter), member 23/24/25/41
MPLDNQTTIQISPTPPPTRRPRRAQVSGWDGAKQLHAEGGHAVRYNGMLDCFARTVREEGAGALFKGIVPNYVKVIPSIAIAFVVYEHVSEALHVEVKISAS